MLRSTWRRRCSPVPKTGQRRPGKRRAGLLTEHVDDRRRQVPQAHRLLDDLFGRAAAGGNDQKRNVQLGLIETRAVAENAGVLAETFTVVRGDDQPGSLQNTAPVELVEQASRAARRGPRCNRHKQRRQTPAPRGERRVLSRSHQCWIRMRWRLSVGATPKRWSPPVRQLIGVMGVEVVQEGEETAAPAAPAATASRATRD